MGLLKKALATASAPCTCETKTEQPPGKISAELRLDMPADWLAVGIMLGQPTPQVP